MNNQLIKFFHRIAHRVNRAIRIFLNAPALLTCGQTMSKISESSRENILLTLENENLFLGKTTSDN